MAFFDFLKRKKEGSGSASANPITLTAINLRLGGDVHSLAGRDVPQLFEQPVPFKNLMGADCCRTT